MSQDFIDAVKDTLDDTCNVSMTENGALGYRTSGHALLDLNFSVASLRSLSESSIVQRFTEAFLEDRITAVKWLFYARDVRGGLGERRLFRAAITDLARNEPQYVKPLLALIPEYGRYDDLWCLLDTGLREDVVRMVRRQLSEDCSRARHNDGISLLAKWLPSSNASAAETKRYAAILRKGMGITERTYRKTLSYLRGRLQIVEGQMSSRQWGDIVYEYVPSRANMIYSDAFLRHDEARRREYLSELERGSTKINAGTLFPHDIVQRYRSVPLGTDATLEQLWKALPDTVRGCGNTIVVADGSGSMTVRVGNTNTTALDVANALAIYFAERSSGQFKDKYITFSMHPQLVDLSVGRTLREKIGIARRHNEVANTNIEAVFDLILSTAIRSRMPQQDLPQNILIISDMEFDYCVSASSDHRGSPTERLFDVIASRYRDAGYQMPRLVFWNVNSRTGTIPVKQNALGVALVSGFSANVVKMVMSAQLDPYECLLETLNGERYAPIGKALEHLQ